ncbi:MAG: glycoside hydrolase family 2 TIM barrel-domain containing protein, partial [Bacteroidales bacterium]
SLLIMASLLVSCGKQHDFQRKSKFNDNWKFFLGDPPEAFQPEFDDSRWRSLELPHDWAIELPVKEPNPGGTANGYFEGGIGWYRKSFEVPAQKEGKTLYLLFDGIFMDSEIWINGNYKGKRNYGYINQIYDITEDLNYGGKNVVAVRVDNSVQPSDRWYHGCGIYRDAELIEANPVHVKPWGSFIRNSVFDTLEAEMLITTDIMNKNEEPKKIKLISHIYHPEDGKVAVVNSGEITIGKELAVDQTVIIKKPDLWSPDNPVVYECVTDILTPSNTILDTYITEFGIRNAEFNPEKGFVLNGEKLIMKGVCLHHDLGATGAAYYPSIMKRRLEILKDAGVNAIRLSHNPYDPHVLSLCDKMGFVVYNEVYDKWEKEWWEENPYRKPFMETWEKDLTNFVLRDRNHPSVVIWSAGNETMEQLQDPERGVEIFNMLYAKFKELDPTRPVTCAMHPHGEDPSRLIHLSDVVSYNYRVEDFEQWRKEFPEYIFIGSETKVYRFRVPETYKTLDFSENSWFKLSEHDAGQFIWTGIDYLGESKGWPDKGMRTGFINTCGFMKPYGYFQKSIYSEKPMVHITVLNDSLRKQLENLDTWQASWYGPPLVSHWNHDKDSVDIYIFSNLDEIEVLLNGNSYVKEKTSDYPTGVVSVRVPYKEGEIEARASSDEHSASHRLTTSGAPVKLHGEATEYPEDKDYDRVVQVEISLLDKEGNLCTVSDIDVQAKYEGSVTFLGSDNGDMSDHRLYIEDSRLLKDGKCLFIFRRKFDGAAYNLRFNAEGYEAWEYVQN